MNKIILHLEGLTFFGLALYIYGYSQFSWVLFFILLFVPDVSMLGFLINQKMGTILYNLFHTYIAPILIIFISILLSHATIFAIGLIWIAHIGMDRMLGYGLKYATAFKDTHLGRV